MFVLKLIQSICVQPRTHFHVLRDFISILSVHRRLIFEMAKREITDRFAGAYLGTLWSIAHPMITMAVYVAVFMFIFRGKVPDPNTPENIYSLNFTIHMISAYLVWMAFTDVLLKSSSCVIGHKALAKQIIFPLEVLPIKSVLASLLPQFIGTIFLLCYTLIAFHTLPWTWIFWPILLVCEVCFLCGIAFFVSAVGVYIRDLKEVLSVITLVGFYLSPILYSELAMPSEQIGRWLKPIMLCNPAAYYIWPFRDACFHGGFVHPVAWIVFPIISILMLVFGYRVFRRLKPQFGNAL